MKVVQEMEEEIFQVEEDLSFDEEFNNTLQQHLEQEQEEEEKMEANEIPLTESIFENNLRKTQLHDSGSRRTALINDDPIERRTSINPKIP